MSNSYDPDFDYIPNTEPLPEVYEDYGNDPEDEVDAEDVEYECSDCGNRDPYRVGHYTPADQLERYENSEGGQRLCSRILRDPNAGKHVIVTVEGEDCIVENESVTNFRGRKGQLAEGDLYVASRNTPLQLLTCREHDTHNSWVIPDCTAYSYDSSECFRFIRFAEEAPGPCTNCTKTVAFMQSA